MGILGNRKTTRHGRGDRSPQGRVFRPAVEPVESRLLMAVSVTSYRYGGNTGYDPSETVLNPSDVNVNTFGKLFSVPLDGNVWAQPLLVANVNVTAGADPGLHDVTYVVTQYDSLYAIDSGTGEVLWKDSFVDPNNGVTPIPTTDTHLG